MLRRSAIRVMIVDKSYSVRLGLRTYLETMANVVLIAEASNGADAMAGYIEEKPHLVLMEVNLPDSNGINIMQNMHKINGKVPVILLTNANGPPLSLSATIAEATSMITKDAKGQELGIAIRDALTGNLIRDPWLPNGLSVDESLGN